MNSDDSPNILTVAPHNGAPCLHVDGKPQSGLAFWHASIEEGAPARTVLSLCL